MTFQAHPISLKPPRLNGLSAKLIASHFHANYGKALRRLSTLRAELAAIERLREHGIDAVSRNRLRSS
jgi:Fe-Mn family superoxide dismutase